MKLEMFPLQVVVNEQQEVEIRQAVSGNQTHVVRITVEQVPFLVDLITQARYHIEELRAEAAARRDAS